MHAKKKILAQQIASNSDSLHLKDPLSSNIMTIKIIVTATMHGMLALGRPWAGNSHALFYTSFTSKAAFIFSIF